MHERTGGTHAEITERAKKFDEFTFVHEERSNRASDKLAKYALELSVGSHVRLD